MPDVLVKGSDWGPNNIVGRDVVEARGGRVVRMDLARGFSTTALTKNVRRAGRARRGRLRRNDRACLRRCRRIRPDDEGPGHIDSTGPSVPYDGPVHVGDRHGDPETHGGDGVGGPGCADILRRRRSGRGRPGAAWSTARMRRPSPVPGRAYGSCRPAST